MNSKAPKMTRRFIEMVSAELHQNDPIVPHKAYVAFLLQFRGQRISEAYFGDIISEFQNKQKVNYTLLKEAIKNKVGLSVNDNGEFIVYEPKTKKRKKRKKK